jgi:beta-galactosidase/beta-glucuronidase
MVGALELLATSPVWIEDVQVYPNVARKSALVKVQIGNASGKAGQGTLAIGQQSKQVDWDEKGGAAELEVALGEAKTWDEFNPALQKLSLRLTGAQADDQRTVTFGLREIGAEGKQFRLNGHPAFFRGTLECCIFPLTGYPPTDVQSWKRIIGICKSYGLNLIRFHSWCPPEAAFIAADELGFYFQVECAVWNNPGDDKVLGDWLYAESERIVRAYGNHPSFMLLTHGNEPSGKGREAFLAGWVRLAPTRHQRLGLPATARESIPRLCGGARAARLAGQGLPQGRAGLQRARRRA